MRRILVPLAILGLLFGFVQPARAQSPALEWKDVGVGYAFGEKITLSVRIISAAPVQSASVLYQLDGDQNTQTSDLAVAADGTATFVYPVQNDLVRPFSRFYFWFRAVLESGEFIDSPHYSFLYADNRFPWQTIDGVGLRIHWVAGDASFGQSALNAARAGYQAIQTLIPVPDGDPIDIYIYDSAAEVQATLTQADASWMAGHASPDLGVVMVSIAPGETQSIEMERQIPHELAHVLLYRLTGSAYASLPTWLVEGISSQAEQYPNADYTQVLTTAAGNKSLLPITDLCAPFPNDASGAILAYAESSSFTRYLHETYGSSGLQSLIKAFSDGLTCEQGAARAFGLPLSQLDLKWRQGSLSEKVSGVAFQNLLPYLAFLGLMLIIPAWQFKANRQKKESQDGKKSQ